MIDLVGNNAQRRNDNAHGLDELRSVLLRDDRAVLEQQSLLIAALSARVQELEQMMVDTQGRTEAVQEVLIEAVTASPNEAGELGQALRPEIEQALYSSARLEDTLLVDAIYPVIGPAIRKSIADIFTTNKDEDGKSFRVEQVLLIERSTGLMLASTATDQSALDDADIVSGMIDALKSFVQDAFEADANDGLSDLRVGDLSVLVETGPRALLASVVRGIPSQDYRNGAAETLEKVHARFATELALFDGSIDAFDGAADLLSDLHCKAAKAEKSRAPWLLVALIVLAMLVSVMVTVGIIFF